MKIFQIVALAAISLFIFGANISPTFLSADFGQKEIPIAPTEVELPHFSPAEEKKGSERVAEVFYTIFSLFQKLLGVVAIAAMVYGGFLMVVNGGNDEKVDDGKRAFSWAALGLVFLLLTEPILRNVIYRGGETLSSAEETRAAASAGTQIVIDAISWFEGILIIAAVGYLLISGFRLIAALGESEEISKQKSVFVWVGVGVVVMLLNEIIVQKIIYPYFLGDDFFVKYAPNPTTGISEIIAIIKYFLQFLALVAFLAFLYGGGMMILSFGDDERVETGKKTLLAAALGLIVILISYALVATFITFQA